MLLARMDVREHLLRFFLVFAVLVVNQRTDTHADTKPYGHVGGKVSGGGTDSGTNGKTQAHTDGKRCGLLVGAFLIVHGYTSFPVW